MLQTIKSSELPEVSVYIEQDRAEYIVGLQMGNMKQPLGSYLTEQQAQSEIANIQKQLGENKKRLARELRRGKPVPLDREMLQTYLLALSKEECAKFVEGMFTLNILLHMITYNFDEMEGHFDKMVDPAIRQSFMIAKRQLNRMLDGLLKVKMLGESEEGYSKIAGYAYRMLDIVNALVNYGCQEDDDFRLIEIEKTMHRLLPNDVMQEKRAKAAATVEEAFRHKLTNYINSANAN